MDYRDPIDEEIKKILEEESRDLKLSPITIQNIKAETRISLKQRIKSFLNREIELPLAPALLAFTLVIGISIFPKDFESSGKTELIDINGSIIIVTNKDEVS